jgi:hypothetical protein
MPTTPSASGVWMGAGCKAAGCKAAGLQAAGLRAAGTKAARVALQAARLQSGCKGCATGCRVDLGSLCKGAKNAVLLHFEVQNSSHLSRASPSKEQHLNTLSKPTHKSGPSVVNSTRIACFWEGCGVGTPPERGGFVTPRLPQHQPKGSRLKATPTRRGSADLVVAVSP